MDKWALDDQADKVYISKRSAVEKAEMFEELALAGWRPTRFQQRHYMRCLEDDAGDVSPALMRRIRRLTDIWSGRQLLDPYVTTEVVVFQRRRQKTREEIIGEGVEALIDIFTR